MFLESDGFPSVNEGDIVYTMECRALYEPGGCGESITQKTRYHVIKHPDFTHLMAKCIDLDMPLRKLSDLRSFGQSWYKTGYRVEGEK